MPLGDGHILIGAVRGAVEAALPGQSTPVIDRIINKVATDPVVQNVTNTEAPVQSRTTLGAIGVILMDLGSIWAMLKSGTFDPLVFSTQMAAIVGALYVLYGRWWPGLAPLFAKKK